MQYITRYIIILLFVPLLCIATFCWADSPIRLVDKEKPDESKVSAGSTSTVVEVNRQRQHSISTSTPTNENLRPWWLGDLINIFGIIIGVVIVVFQLGRQHRNGLNQQKENHREQFRIQIYQEFSRLLGIASEKISHSKMYAFLIPTHVHIYHDQISKGFNPSPLPDRVMELNRRHYDSLQAAADLMILIERYQIVEPRLDIFRTALGVAHHDMLKAFGPLFDLLLTLLPSEIPLPNGAHKTVNIVNPSDEQIDALEKLVDAYTTESDNMICYLYDLNVELQNTLLVNLFPNKAPRRVPLDPKFKVVSTEPDEMEKLRKYFDQETDWGKEKKKTEQSVFEQVERR